eukprot:gene5691-6878_t
MDADGNVCKAKRFSLDDGRRVQPTAWSIYFGMEAALDSLASQAGYARSYFSLNRRAPATDEFQAPPVWLSQLYAQAASYIQTVFGVDLFDPLQARVYRLGIDWEETFKNKSYSHGLILMHPTDLEPAISGQVQFSKVVQIVSGPRQPTSMRGHLQLLAKDIRKFATHGYRTCLDSAPVKTFLLIGIDADEPARAKLCSFVSHSGYTYCFNCKFVGNSFKGTLRFPGYCSPCAQTTYAERESQKKTISKAKAKRKRGGGEQQDGVGSSDWSYHTESLSAIFA